MSTNFTHKNDFTDSPIRQIYNLKTSQKTTIDLNFTLQIIYIKQLDNISSLQQNKKNTNILSLTLSDQEYFYNGFILVLDKNLPELALYDLIDIRSLTVFSNSGKQKLFVIKNYGYFIYKNKDK